MKDYDSDLTMPPPLPPPLPVSQSVRKASSLNITKLLALTLMVLISAGGITILPTLAGVIISLICLVPFVALWLLPGFIASNRKHHNQAAIWAITILTGWTFVGWVAALVWALTNPPAHTSQLTVNGQIKAQVDISNPVAVTQA